MSARIEVSVVNRSGGKLDEGGFSSLAAAVLKRLGFKTGELGVAFVTSKEISLLNRQHMDCVGPTDVLSFPLDVDDAEAGGEVPRLLGDVIICPEVAAEQARVLGNTTQEELCLLLIHGILHISGHDHEADSGQMDELQAQLFDEVCKSRPERN